MDAEHRAKNKFYQKLHFKQCQRKRDKRFFATLDYIPVIQARHIYWNKDGYIVPRGKTYNWQVTPLTSHITRLIYKKKNTIKPSDKGRLARIIDHTPKGNQKNIVVITKVIAAKGTAVKAAAQHLGVVTSVFTKRPGQKVDWSH